METVARFTEPYLAHIAKGRLEAEGVSAVVLDEHIVSMNWLYSFAVGGVRTQVLDSDLDQARLILKKDFFEELLETSEAQQAPSPEDICPKCRSLSISGNPYSFWSLIPSLFFSAPIFFRKKKWVCNDCNSKW